MSQWHLIIDVARCENCGNCVLAAKDEYVGNDFRGYSAPHPSQGAGVLQIDRTVRGAGSQVDTAYLPRMCNHCADAPCMKVAPDAISRRPDGIVIIDPVKAKGRRDIVASCPYGAVIWNEERQLPQHWIFDAHLLDQGWKQPRCEQVCPTGAISSVRATDAAMEKRAVLEELEVLKPELGTRPRIYYRNLYRVQKCAIFGSAFSRRSGIPDCVEGAQVTLSQEGVDLGTTTTDSFGDFKFDRLDPGSGYYRVEIQQANGGRAVAEANLVGGESIALGDLELM